MKFLTNKYLVLGSLLFILISIPITLYFISRQQELRGRAAPSSKLFFSPENPVTSTQCESFNVDIMVDPGANIVSIVDFYLKYDPTKLDILQIRESESFPTVVRNASITSGEANMSVSVGADVTKAVQTPSRVATVSFRPKAAGTALIQFDQEKSRVFSLAPADEPTENVLFQVSPANTTIGTGTCPTAIGTPVPTVPATPTPTPTVAPGVGGGPSPTPIPSPTPTPISAPTPILSPTPTSTPSGQITPTITPTLQPPPVSTPTATPTVIPISEPTIPPPGGVLETIGIIGAIILTIIGGLALLTL
jgi:hypothetical protein